MGGKIRVAAAEFPAWQQKGECHGTAALIREEAASCGSWAATGKQREEGERAYSHAAAHPCPELRQQRAFLASGLKKGQIKCVLRRKVWVRIPSAESLSVLVQFSAFFVGMEGIARFFLFFGCLPPIWDQILWPLAKLRIYLLAALNCTSLQPALGAAQLPGCARTQSCLPASLSSPKPHCERWDGQIPHTAPAPALHCLGSTRPLLQDKLLSLEWAFPRGKEYFRYDIWLLAFH